MNFPLLISKFLPAYSRQPSAAKADFWQDWAAVHGQNILNLPRFLLPGVPSITFRPLQSLHQSQRLPKILWQDLTALFRKVEMARLPRHRKLARPHRPRDLQEKELHLPQLHRRLRMAEPIRPLHLPLQRLLRMALAKKNQMTNS